MPVTPWKTSDDIVESVSRKIAIPISQGTFSVEDILSFATEELFISQIPSVMTFHEEYFVWSNEIPLVSNKTRYPIPDRAIGMKIRDLFYKDTSGNLREMTRISEEDKAFFQRGYDGGTIQSQTATKYYLEGNDVILASGDVSILTGSLVFSFFLRPNVLVPNERAAIIQNFCKTITINNSTLTAGDKLSINSTNFVAGTDFTIGVDSATTAANLNTAITMAGAVSSTSVSTSIITVYYDSLSDYVFSTTQASTGISVQSGQGLNFLTIPENIVSGNIVDLLQTKSGHSMRAYGIQLGTSAVSTNIINFNAGEVPDTVVVGDYLCLENECIIPQIPTDLHSGLAERTCARILASLGDQQGLAASTAKIQEIDQRQGTLLGSRVEGSPIKIRPRNSLLSIGKKFFRY